MYSAHFVIVIYPTKHVKDMQCFRIVGYIFNTCETQEGESENS